MECEVICYRTIVDWCPGRVIQMCFVYCILYVYGEDNTNLKKLCRILLSLFRQ